MVAVGPAADGVDGVLSVLRLMRIGDPVIYRGRALTLLGIDPMSVPERRAEVEDPYTGERLTVAFDELEEALPDPPGFDPAA
jgi:hypothetical protein